MGLFSFLFGKRPEHLPTEVPRKVEAKPVEPNKSVQSRPVDSAWLVHCEAIEQALLDNYRHSPLEGQAAIKATCAAFAQSAVKKKAG